MMKINILSKPEVIMSNPDSKHGYFGWPTVARLQDDTIAAVASGFRLSHVCPFGKAVMSYSYDDGKTFTAPAPIIDTPLDDRDAGLCTFGKTGVIITSFNNTVEFQRQSGVGGAYKDAYLDQVTPELEAKYLGSEFRISNDCGRHFGPIYKSPVTSPHGPLELKDGTILWMGTTFSAGQGHDIMHLEAWTINPEDGSMQYLSTVEYILNPETGKRLLSCEPHTIQLESGRLICHFRLEDEGYFSTCQTVSDDNGKTWSKPVQLLERTGGAPAHLIKHSSGALISVYGYRNKPYGIRFMYSTDNGETWNTDNVLWDEGPIYDLGYPASVELKDGSILTVFYAVYPEVGCPALILKMNWTFEL